MGIIELIASSLLMYALYKVKRGFRIKTMINIISIIVIGVLIALIVFKKGEHFTLIWTIFVPIAAIFIYGTKIGLRISILFYVVAFYLTFQGLDIWQNGAWNVASYIRFVAANMILTLTIYLLKLSLESAFDSIDKTREKEKAHLELITKHAITDPLTKLYNRRYLDETFHKNFQLAKHSHNLYIFFILDLDFFKVFNDTHGHKAGDDVLTTVSEILMQNMRRDGDYAFRIGGEEFGCLIMAQDEAHVFDLVEKIRKEVEDTKLITASFGVCIINKFDYEDFDAMYKSADKFLYEAKHKGRNQVVGELTHLYH
jgi:diguanylate cyclase (GGDEF)-like protein